MKSLARIIMVNWYLFEAEEWDIEGHVALVGKNGSGKSSFIDAIQLIMLGGSQSDWTPNAKASEKNHKRDIRGYVLGIVKDEEAIGDSALYQPRPDALSRIVLVFKDDKTGECISVGGAFTAHRNDPQATIEGYFIAHNMDMRLADLLDAGECVRSYSDLKAVLRQKVVENNLYLFAHEPKKFMTQMMYSLGPEGRPTVLTKFRKAFKQSINMSGLDRPVSEFVKGSVLDTDILNLDQARQSYKTYLNKQEAVARIKEQIDILEEISTHFQRGKRAGERRAGYAWAAEELRFNSLTEQMEGLENELHEMWDRYRKIKVARYSDVRELASLQGRLSELRLTLKSDGPVSQQERLIEQRETLFETVRRSDDQLGRIQNQIQRASDIVKFGELVPSNISANLDELVRISHGNTGQWPLNPIMVDSLVKDTREQFPKLLKEIDDKRGDIGVKARQIQDQYAEDIERVNNLKEGGADLRKTTLKLIAVLKEAGIESVPVCELVEVVDPFWQPAIEGYLRSNTEALIVPPEDAEKAVDIYRNEKRKGLSGTTVIASNKVQYWHDDPVPGTAAALIEGTDAIAVAYIRRLLRGITLADETRSFLQEDRALTRDGMFIRQAGVQRLILPEYPQLGKAAKPIQIERIQQRINDLREQLLDLNTQHGEYKALYDTVAALNTKLEDIPSIELIVSEKNTSLRQIESLTNQIDAIDTSHVAALQKQLAETENKAEELNRAIKRHIGDIGGIRKAYRLKNSDRHKLGNILPEIAANRDKCANDEDFSMQRASELCASLEEEMDQGYELIISKAMSRIDDAAKEQRTNETRAHERLGSYLTNYPNDSFSRNTLTNAGIRTEVDLLLQQLVDTGLQERQQEVNEAKYRMLKVMRSDLAIRLRGHINNMIRRINELNQELNDRPFSADQKYSFTYRQLDEYAEYLRYINNIDQETALNVDSLFDEHEHLNDWIVQMLDEKMGDILGDYRNYYHFDIAIRDEKAGITEMLSRKAGSASGGENKTPFYVAMGASLASAYRLERLPDGAIHGGVSLYLADEAFEKMDRTNTRQAADYLKSIGLQLFVAAPDDAEPRLREVVNTVMFFIKEGARATIEVDYIKPKARELLATITNTATSQEQVVSA